MNVVARYQHIKEYSCALVLSQTITPSHLLNASKLATYAVDCIQFRVRGRLGTRVRRVASSSASLRIHAPTLQDGESESERQDARSEMHGKVYSLQASTVEIIFSAALAPQVGRCL